MNSPIVALLSRAPKPRQSRLIRCLMLGFAFAAFTMPAGAQQMARNGTIQASIQPDGNYQLTFPTTGWTLEGTLPGGARELRAATGKDRIGAYRQVRATFNRGGRMAEIRVYDALPVALFRDVWKRGGNNVTPFPAFQSLPNGLMRFAYQQKNFGPYEFGKLGPQGPWALFDKQNHVMLLSPADHFQVSRMNELPEGGAESRILSTIGTLPAGFAHGTLIAVGNGMNHVFATWGMALQKLGGKPRIANDANVTLAKLGYWTDNLTTYYYKFDPKLGYTGTLLAVRDEFKKLGVPLCYMQLDSWFYPKGPQARWDARGTSLPFGEYVYRADKGLFPEGLEAFHSVLGLPLVTHARWISPASPYHTEFKMSGNVVIDPKFWKQTADYLRKAGVVTYEQDWLDHNAQTELNLHDPPLFLGEMAKAMGHEGLTIQYCMPLPSDYMASTLYPSVQTIRTSRDGFERTKWDSFLYDSRLASAVGLWPWTDAFFSKDLGSLVIATLSAGPVGVGDAIGEADAKNLMAVVRPDGVIVKPDVPLLPVDDMYASDAADKGTPMVATAVTDFGDLQVQYVFAYPRKLSDTEVTVPLTALGISGSVFAYDWVMHCGQLIPQGGSLRMEFKDGWAYWVLSPVSREGIALLGDTRKIVPLGKGRIPAVRDQGEVVAVVKFAPDESVLTISGYASHRPKLDASSGEIKNVTYNEQTQVFAVQVLPARSNEAEIRVVAR